MIVITFLFALSIFGITLIAGGLPFQRRLKTVSPHSFLRSEALASGVFLGAGLIHMLNDAAKSFQALGVVYPVAFLLCGVSFLVLLFLEHLGGEIREHQQQHGASIAILAVVMLSIHSFLEGAALGLSTQLATSLLIFLAIIAHKWAASFSLAVQINKSSLGLWSALGYFMIFAMMTPLGIFLGYTANAVTHQHLYFAPIFSAIAAGTFLYIGTLHGLKRSIMVERCCNLQDFSFVILGFALMAVVGIWT